MEERDWSKDWEMCQRATFGDWRQEELGGEKIAIRTDFSTVAVLDGASRYGTHYLREDAQFIVESREALPYWLERVRELEGRLKALEERRCETCRWWNRMPGHQRGTCRRSMSIASKILERDTPFVAFGDSGDGEGTAWLETEPDFGCVCWEAKEAGP